MGTHVIKCWSNTQSTVALSSAEAELTGICQAAGEGLGLKALCHDLGLDLEVRVHADAAAAIGICRRRGLGRIRHLAVADLWVQDKLRSKDFVLTKILGAANPADSLTKHLDHSTLMKHLDAMGLCFEDGRPESAPTLTNLIFERCLPNERTKRHDREHARA